MGPQDDMRVLAELYSDIIFIVVAGLLGYVSLWKEHYIQKLVVSLSSKLDIQDTNFEEFLWSSPLPMHLYKLQNGYLRLTQANPAADELFKRNHSTFIGKKLEEIFPKLPKMSTPSVYMGIAKGLTDPTRFDFIYMDEEITGSFDCHVFRVPPDSLVISFTDISPRLRAENEHRELKVQSEQARRLETLGSLAGGVAHDLNHVFSVIVGLTDNITRDDLSPEMHKLLDNILRVTIRGRGVVQSLLYCTKKNLDNIAPLDLNRTVEHIVDSLRESLDERWAITVDLEENLGLIEGDIGSIERALLNLCDNSIEAMPDGGELELGTTLNEEDGVIEVYVRDTGTGMTPELRRRAMDPFFTTKSTGGVGLGLSMTYGTMNAHRGTLDIQSAVGLGTSITLRFPIMETAPRTRPFTGENLHILLVDDDELVRLSFTPMLELLGHEVTTASSGLAAIKLFEQGLVVDLVILDLNMAGFSGAQTLPIILEINAHQRILMASGSQLDMDKALIGLPKVPCLRKPFSLKELRERIKEFSDPSS